MPSGKCLRLPQKEKKFPTATCFHVFLALFRCPEERDDDSARISLSGNSLLNWGVGRSVWRKSHCSRYYL